MIRVVHSVILLGLMSDMIWAQDASQAVAPAPPDIRLVGEEVTAEAMTRLANRDWNSVTLVSETFSGTIIEPLRHASSIRSLRLFGKNSGGQLPRLENINGLESLELSTQLSGDDFEAIGRLTQLQRLSLPGNLREGPTINVIGAIEIAKLTKLKSLGLYHVNIDDASFTELRTLVQLEELDLSHTRVTDAGLLALQQMPKLRKLELHRHPMCKQQLSNACIPLVCRLSQLEQLSLSGKITGESVPAIAALPNLKSLSLTATDIYRTDLAPLRHSSIEILMLTPHQAGMEAEVENSPLLPLRECRHLKHVWVIGQPINRPELQMQLLQRVLPNVGIGFSS